MLSVNQKNETKIMLILFETCLMTALTYGLEACTFSRKKEVRELERI